jgi:cation diffusion facilitator family transporter
MTFKGDAALKSPSLKRYAVLSIIAAVSTIVLKAAAYKLTGSVGLLSDAMESFVNLAGALMALAMLSIAARPADEGHPFGHTKAEYFSSGVEGTLILVAAISIGAAAVHRLIDHRPLEQIGIGLGVSVAASLINLGAALVLLKAGKTYRSITLEANAHHLLTDVWTSAGVIVGVSAAYFTGYEQIDPVVALLVAAQIVWSGIKIVRSSVLGLMDSAADPEDMKKIETVLDTYKERGAVYHALRTRQAGSRLFVSLHVLVPGSWTVQKGHDLLEEIENDLKKVMVQVTVFTHLESIDDPVCWNDADVNGWDIR